MIELSSSDQPVDIPADAYVLLVEDDPDDIHVIKRVLKRAPLSITVETCAHGREALDLLDMELEKDNRKIPDLILLDLNMPVMDGNAFLRAVREKTRLSAIPICVFTTSTDEDIIRRAYNDGANAVVSKVDSLDGMSQILNTIIDFWFRTANRYYV
jgi:two-component system response regulator